MKLSRDSIIYKRIEVLEVYEKRKAIEEEFHCREDFNMFCRMYDTKINHYNWKPISFDEKAIRIMDNLREDKQKYFKSILLLGEWYNKNNENRIFTIEKEIFANFGHIPYDDNMGKELDKLDAKECNEYVNGIWWDSRKKAILRPNLKLGSYDTGVNIHDFYIGLSTGMTKEEAKSFAVKAIEELYKNSEKYQSELSDIDFMYSICDLEDEKITNTNWADILFIYDYIELYSLNGKFNKTIEEEVHKELLQYHDYEVEELKQVGSYSNSHIRNWIAKIRKEIEQ